MTIKLLLIIGAGIGIILPCRAQNASLKRISGLKGRSGFEYIVTETEEYNRLTTAIDAHITTILKSIRDQPC
jgi:hypothetical protein